MENKFGKIEGDAFPLVKRNHLFKLNSRNLGITGANNVKKKWNVMWTPKDAFNRIIEFCKHVKNTTFFIKVHHITFEPQSWDLKKMPLQTMQGALIDRTSWSGVWINPITSSPGWMRLCSICPTSRLPVLVYSWGSFFLVVPTFQTVDVLDAIQSLSILFQISNLDIHRAKYLSFFHICSKTRTTFHVWDLQAIRRCTAASHLHKVRGMPIRKMHVRRNCCKVMFYHCQCRLISWVLLLTHAVSLRNGG